jgi:Ca2+-binding RTX toxin-like protein
MGDDVSNTLVAVDGNNAVDQSVSEADVGTTDTLDGGAGNNFLIGVDGDILLVGTGNDEFGLDADFSKDQVVV